MPDAMHWWDDDLQVSNTGDIALSDGIDLSNQRIVRRLMTILGEYVWHVEYGASVPKRIGDTLDLSLVESVIRNQIYLEEAVSKEDDITLEVSPILNGVFVSLVYIEALSGRQASLQFDAVL